MKFQSAVRLAVLSAVLCFAGAAHAFSIDLMSHGNYSFPAAGFFAVNEKVVWQDSNAVLPALTSMTYTANQGTLVGAGTYTNGVDSLSYSFKFTTDIPTDGFSSTQNAHAIWTYTGGTGAFANLMGSGVLASNFNAPLGGTSLTEFSGLLVAVPEPASYAVLGLGVVALIRRRKKA